MSAAIVREIEQTVMAMALLRRQITELNEAEGELNERWRALTGAHGAARRANLTERAFHRAADALARAAVTPVRPVAEDETRVRATVTAQADVAATSPQLEALRSESITEHAIRLRNGCPERHFGILAATAERAQALAGEIVGPPGTVWTYRGHLHVLEAVCCHRASYCSASAYVYEARALYGSWLQKVVDADGQHEQRPT